jgi:hypothetical protein
MADRKKAWPKPGSEEFWTEDTVPVRVPLSIRRRLRLLAAQQDKRLQEVVAVVLDEALKEWGV